MKSMAKKKGKGKPLSKLQRAFFNNLLSKKYKTQAEAYIAAGYKARGRAAETNASRLLSNAKFKAHYDKAMAKAAETTDINAERVLREEGRIAFADIAEIFDKGTLISPSELPEDIRRAISGVEIIERFSPGEKKWKEVKYKYRFWDKGRSLERLGKHLKLYKDQAKLELGFDGDTVAAWKLILQSIGINSDPAVLPGREGV
jgi:phage terminase small subunit